MLGARERFAAVPFFWSAHYERYLKTKKDRFGHGCISKGDIALRPRLSFPRAR